MARVITLVSVLKTLSLVSNYGFYLQETMEKCSRIIGVRAEGAAAPPVMEIMRIFRVKRS